MSLSLDLKKHAKTICEIISKGKCSDTPISRIQALKRGDCKDCDLNVPYIALDVVKAFLVELFREKVIVDRKELQDFMRANNRNLLEMFCQQGPPSKHWIETKGQYWVGWNDSNQKVQKFFDETFSQKGSLKRLLESSPEKKETTQ